MLAYHGGYSLALPGTASLLLLDVTDEISNYLLFYILGDK